MSAAGVASCIDANTGELHWRARLAGEYYASPVAMAGKVYFTNSFGITTVVAADSSYRVLAANDVGEPVTTTMAAVDGNLSSEGTRTCTGSGPDSCSSMHDPLPPAKP